MNLTQINSPSLRLLLGCCALLSAHISFAQTPVNVVQAVASSAQAGYLGPQNVISNDGLVQDPPGSGNFRLTTDALPYNSGYGSPNDEAPLIHFDFGRTRTIDRIRIWNPNGTSYTFRGAKDITIQFSSDSERWTSVPERVTVARGPGTDSYYGELKVLARPITARYIRFCINSTHRDFPQSDIASLGKVRFYAGGTKTTFTDTGEYPQGAGLIDVKAAPYNAKGDGVADDTAAIQQAIRDWEGRDRIVYLPAGTYRVTSPIRFRSNSSSDRNWYFGRNHLLGAGSTKTTVRLDNNRLTDAGSPQPVIGYGVISFWNGWWEETTADWFNNTLKGLTVDIGSGNPGAKGIEFFSNNTGSVRDVRIVSRDGQGAVGLDLGHADKNGPLLVKGLAVEGFSIGVNTGATVNSQTLEDIRLSGQNTVAFQNNGQCVSVRGLTTNGTVPAFKNLYGFAYVMNGSFTGTGAASTTSAVTNGEFLVGRDLTSAGFGSLIQNNHGNAASIAAASTTQFLSHTPALTLFPNSTKFLRLRVEETPIPATVPSRDWGNVRNFRRTEEPDDTLAFQRAVDYGYNVVYFPSDAAIVLRGDVFVEGRTRRIVGFHANIQVANGAKVRLGDGRASAVLFEGFKGIELVNESSRTLAVIDSECSVSTEFEPDGVAGKTFLENVGGTFRFGRGSVWARQLNSEPEGLKIRNDGGRLWVLGLKTERAGTLVETVNAGKTEILGGLCYTTTDGTAPMFTTLDSSLAATIAEISYGPPPYGTLVQETRLGVTRNLLRGQAPFRFSFMNGSAIPLFRGGN